jgi:hypothetical protein
MPVHIHYIQEIPGLVAAREREDLVDRQVQRVKPKPDVRVGDRRQEPP